MCETPPPKLLLKLLRPQLPQMLAMLRKFVLAESPSLEKPPADRCCGIVASEWRKRRARVERMPQKQRGDHLRITESARLGATSRSRTLRHGVRERHAGENAVPHFRRQSVRPRHLRYESRTGASAFRSGCASAEQSGASQAHSVSLDFGRGNWQRLLAQADRNRGAA